MLEITPHAALRLAQRGMAVRDLDLALVLGVQVEGGLLVRHKEVQNFLRGLKELSDRAERLTGKRLVLDGARLVTGYRARPRKQKRLLARAEERSLGGGW